MSYHLSLYNGPVTQATVSLNVSGDNATAHLSGLTREQLIPFCNLIVYHSTMPQQLLDNYIATVLAESPPVPIILATRDHNYSYNDDTFIFAHCFKAGHSVDQLLRFSAGLLFGKEDVVTIR